MGRDGVKLAIDLVQYTLLLQITVKLKMDVLSGLDLPCSMFETVHKWLLKSTEIKLVHFQGMQIYQFLFAYLLNRDKVLKGRTCSLRSKFFSVRPDLFQKSCINQGS